jgi:hypothetical protein
MLFQSSLQANSSESETRSRPPSPPLPQSNAAAQSLADVLIVVGSAGTPEYARMFGEWSARWEQAARDGDATFHQIAEEDVDAGGNQKPILRERLESLAAEETLPLWVVLIGHGTFDGREAKFNLAGEDVSDLELQAWLSGVQRPIAFINCTSASGAFFGAMSGPGRVVVTATKSGQEINFARFGDYFSRAVADPATDIDRDGQVSLLEAFLRASRQTEEFYAGENRLATEHALLDDNGDGRGVRAEDFEGVRPLNAAGDSTDPDGLVAHQWHLVPSAEERDFPPELRPRRNELELAVMRLREQKERYGEDEYLGLLQPLLVELARLYEQADQRQLDGEDAARDHPTPAISP